MEFIDLNLNKNLLNLIASYKKTGQSDEVIQQSLWQLGMNPEQVEAHLKYYNENKNKISKDTNMKLTLEKLHVQTSSAVEALNDMHNDKQLGYSAFSAQSIIEQGMAQLQIQNDDKAIMEEKIKAGYAVEDSLVNPVAKYMVAEGMYNALVQYEWLKPVEDLNAMIKESFATDKWNYVTAKFASNISTMTKTPAYANLYENLLGVFDAENTREALKSICLQTSWCNESKKIFNMIKSEELAEIGEVHNQVYENANCSICKTISPMIVREGKQVFFLNGKNYEFDGKSLTETKVDDVRYNNVLEGLSVLKYDTENNKFTYNGKNNLMLEYNCNDESIRINGGEDMSKMSLLDLNETLKRCGIFDRETIGNCEKIVKFFESKDLLTDIDIAKTVKNNNFAGVFVTVIGVDEGVYVNKVNYPMAFNEMKLYPTASEACKEIKSYMKYDATKILESRLKVEGEKKAVIESKRAEINDNIAFLEQKRAELMKAMNETNNDERLAEAVKLVESEIKKFEKQLQESYLDEPVNPDAVEYDHDDMIKNGYTEVTVVTPVDGVAEGDKVLVSATEYGELSDDAMITCIKADGKSVLMPKHNLKVEI